MPVPRGNRTTQQNSRTPQQIFNRHLRVSRHRHKRGIGAVFQQAAHEIGQQFTMSAHRRIGPAGQIRILGEKMPVQRVSHAVQPLEFITLRAFGLGQQRRNRQGVMGGKLRIEPRAGGKQAARTGLITQIRHRLACKHRIVGKTTLLCTLDLAVPISAFHQTHHHAAIESLCQIITPIDDAHGAFLIGLYCQAEPVPSRKRGIGKHSADDIKRQFQPIRLLGINRKIQIIGFGLPRQIQQNGAQLFHDLRMGGGLVTRMQSRQFNRNTRTVRQGPVTCPFANHGNCLMVRRLVMAGILIGAGTLAQHVIRIPKQLPFGAGGAAQGLFNGLPQHEMLAQQTHGLTHGNAQGRQTNAFAQLADQIIRRFARTNNPCRQPQGPCRGCDHQGIGLDFMMQKISLSQLVLDQFFSRQMIGHPQQSLGQNHQSQTFGGRKRISAQQILDPANPVPRIADSRNQIMTQSVDLALVLRIKA